MTRTIKKYRLADMTQTSLPWVNSWSAKLYDQNGLEVALQGNFDEHRRRVEGSSPVHQHHHDELVYLLEGYYVRHNEDNVDQLAFNFLRIQAGVEHGGGADGVWISAKPKDFQFSALGTERRAILYQGSQLGLGVKYLPMYEGIIPPYEGIIISRVVGIEIIAKDTYRMLKISVATSSSSTDIMSFEFLE